MDKEDDISREELELIEKTKIDTEVLEKVKKKYPDIFFRTQLRKALQIIENNLQKDENIEFYFVGINHTIETIRIGLAASLFFSKISHPIFGWKSKCVIVCTNKRKIFVEMTMGFEYGKQYNISDEIKIKKDRDFFYLQVNGDSRDTVIQLSIDRYNMITEYLKQNSNLIQDDKLNVKLPLKAKIVPYFFIAFFIWIIIVFTINVFRYGIDIYR